MYEAWWPHWLQHYHYQTIVYEHIMAWLKDDLQRGGGYCNDPIISHPQTDFVLLSLYSVLIDECIDCANKEELTTAMIYIFRITVVQIHILISLLDDRSIQVFCRSCIWKNIPHRTPPHTRAMTPTICVTGRGARTPPAHSLASATRMCLIHSDRYLS